MGMSAQVVRTTIRRVLAGGLVAHTRLPILLVAVALPLALPFANAATVGRVAATYGVLALGYAVVFGLAGQFTVAHAALYGVGAYVTAILTARANIDPWVVLPIAAAGGALAGAVVGCCALRVRGDVLAIVTLAVGQLAQVVMLAWTPVTGGFAGISDVPALTFQGTPLISDAQQYVVAAALLVTSAIAVDRLRGSRFGLALQTIREDETVAATAGIAIGAHKVAAFALSGVFAGAAGWLEATALGAVSPTTFDIVFSVLIAVMVLLAGSGRVYAVIAAATTIALLQDALKTVPEVETAVIGLAIVVIVIARSRPLMLRRRA